MNKFRWITRGAAWGMVAGLAISFAAGHHIAPMFRQPGRAYFVELDDHFVLCVLSPFLAVVGTVIGVGTGFLRFRLQRKQNADALQSGTSVPDHLAGPDLQ